jgi:hypothetical protein
MKHFLASMGLFILALWIGVIGYHSIADFSWLDSFLNASMILSGMGPIGAVKTAEGKIFASIYALFSGIIFAAGVGITFAPIVQRMLHRLHLEDSNQVDKGDENGSS